MKKIFFLFLFICLLAACNDDGSRNIEAYYFPLKNLKEGKIYEYRSVGSRNDPPVYWHYQSIEEGGREYLLGTAYDQAFLPDQSIKEEKVKNGMKLIGLSVFEADSTGNKQQITATIEQGNVFPFNVKKPANVLLTSLHWQSLADSATIYLIRNRQYDSDTVFLFNEKNIEAVKFNILELVEHDAGGRLSLESKGEEVYAKGIGLVSFKKDISAEWQMAYLLDKIYTVSEFERNQSLRE
ncbi:MAG TPA: hypothetical protein ENJ95_24775 [Bacteroidetes bacterium]|nr:hypothetical protein [Bacteroidota bacterium]